MRINESICGRGMNDGESMFDKYFIFCMIRSNETLVIKQMRVHSVL